MKLITAGGLFFFLLGLAVLAEQILAQQIPIQPRQRFHSDPTFDHATDELVNGRFSAA